MPESRFLYHIFAFWRGIFCPIFSKISFLQQPQAKWRGRNCTTFGGKKCTTFGVIFGPQIVVQFLPLRGGTASASSFRTMFSTFGTNWGIFLEEKPSIESRVGKSGVQFQTVGHVGCYFYHIACYFSNGLIYSLFIFFFLFVLFHVILFYVMLALFQQTRKKYKKRKKARNNERRRPGKKGKKQRRKESKEIKERKERNKRKERKEERKTEKKTTTSNQGRH